MEKCCIICGSTVPIFTNSAWIFAFRQASDQRGDDLAESCRRCCHILVSQNFISTYCCPDHIQRFLKRMKEIDCDNPHSYRSSSKLLRSSIEGIFNFREHCLFCGEECKVIWPQKNPNRWREAYLCRTADGEGYISFKQSVIRHAESRSDN